MILWSASSIGKRVSLLGVLPLSVWLLTDTPTNGQATTAPNATTQKAPTATPTKQVSADNYRALRPADKLRCYARVAEMEYTFFGNPSGTLVSFDCLDKEGKERSIELKTKDFDDGKIRTKDFGTILMKRTSIQEAAAGKPMTDPLSANYEMKESQIKSLRAFLGF